MTSKDNDTMPLPGFSQELSSDITADEDFIPTSQPQSVASSKGSRNSDTILNKSSEELTVSHLGSTLRIDDMLPLTAVIDESTLEKDKSADFIPDTDTKKSKFTYPNELSCKKKLEVFDHEVAFKVQMMNPSCETDVSQIPESPALDSQNFSVLRVSPAKVFISNQEAVKKIQESITEIIVNDSAETVDLEVTPVNIKNSENIRIEEKIENFSPSSDVEKCEDTQIFDNSILLLDQPGPSHLDSDNRESISGVTSKESYPQDTVDDNKENSQDRANNFNVQCSPGLATASASIKLETVDAAKMDQYEVQAKPVCAEPNTCSNTTVKKIDFKLTVSETPKPKPKPTDIEHVSDNTSEKSKRHSTSSSGSVYSDKMGIPFALPKRLSIVSDQTDSSEEDFSIQFKKERRKLERMPWSNEYLLPLKMDDMIQVAIDKEEFLKRPSVSSPRKPKSRQCNGVNQLKEILENSSSCQTSVCDLLSNEPQPANTENTEETSKTNVSENAVPEMEKANENVKNREKNQTDTNDGGNKNVQFDDGEQLAHDPGPETETEAEVDANAKKEMAVQQTPPEKEITSVRLCDGLSVFARWTDKRYYSGVLSGNVKNDRWDVKFDDGTFKTVREDLIMPANWLKTGALVFALLNDNYESGQIINIKRSKKKINYIVELDTQKKEIEVKISDLCLTDVMAGIVREKYKPLTGTPKGRADIDFDNVLSGKRLREQRTPLRPSGTVGVGSSGVKKKSSKSKKDEGNSLESVKETPQNKGTGMRIGRLKSVRGHLIEDKIISTESPSENETRETPLRGSPKEARGKGKPRSLSYEPEETGPEKNKNKPWVTPDGNSIPGPSGIKLKKRRAKAELETAFTKGIEPIVKRSSKKSPARPRIAQSNEKSNRKRKLDEFVDENIQKKSFRDGSSKVKTRSRKG